MLPVLGKEFLFYFYYRLFEVTGESVILQQPLYTVTVEPSGVLKLF